tara:strand:- start:292 stop:450 length:159 start_codon:yes stop_codon:yes gene_type:complete
MLLPSSSIALPTKDRAFIIEPLIESILSQDFQDFELIVTRLDEELDCNIEIQ